MCIYPELGKWPEEGRGRQKMIDKGKSCLSFDGKTKISPQNAQSVPALIAISCLL